MTRGNQDIKGIYLNVIKVSTSLDPEFQRRVLQVAKTSKNEDLAAALARREDTLPEIDDDLGSWGSAKVQSAWFARPGRDLAAVAKRLGREKRVTVLEVIAALPDLDPSIYEICARRNAARVALHLVANASAPAESRLMAVRTLAKEYIGLSYARQGALMASLSACDPEVADAFIAATVDLTVATRAMSSVSTLSTEATEHVFMLCTKRLREAKKLHARAAAEQATHGTSTSRSGYTRWNSATYELNTAVRELVENVKPLSVLAADIGDRAEFFEALEALMESCRENHLGQADVDVLTLLESVKSCVLSTNGGEVVGSPASMIKAAGSSESVMNILTELQSNRRLDRSAAMAALLSPHADEEIARTATRAFGWGESLKILETKHRDLSTIVKVVLLAASYGVNDRHIEAFSSNSTPVEFWTAMVTYYARLGNIPSELLQSKFARVDVIPKLPLRIFSQPDLPGWLVTGFAEYLASELTTQAAWDGFEVLAPTHLGAVAQVIRAAKLSTRHNSAQ